MTQSAVDSLYSIFSKYQLNDKITGHYCSVCLDEEYNKFLHDRPLKELGPDSFLTYLSSIDIIDESCNDFKYFIPRLLEIIYETESHANYFFEQIWQTIAKANYHSWPDNEKTEINNFFTEYWHKVKSSGDQNRIECTIDNFSEIGFNDYELNKA